MKSHRFVETGAAVVAHAPVILRSTPLGSCIAVVFHAPAHRMGAMAHVMLPGRAPACTPADLQNRYACNALDYVATSLRLHGCAPDGALCCLVGGANVLDRSENRIGPDNLDSARKWLQSHGFVVVAKAVGGYHRRCAWLDLSAARILYTEADSRLRPLWPPDPAAERTGGNEGVIEQ